MLAMLLPNVVFQYVLPQDASGATNKKLKKYTIVVSGIITVLVIAAVPFVIPAFFHEFNETIEVAQIMSLALIPSTLSLIYTSEFLAIEKNKIVLISSGLSVLVLIMGILTLGKYFDVIGMAVAVIIARSSEFILLYWARKKNHYQTKPA
jgi:O-antigen/teichoic acid export membrane protein